MRPCFPSFVSENGRFLFGKGKLSLLCPFILDTDLNRGVVIFYFLFFAELLCRNYRAYKSVKLAPSNG